MSDSGETCCSSINLLLFTVGGVFFGMDADQISEMVAYKGEKAEDLFWFHEEIGFNDKRVTYHAPTIVAIKRGGESPYLVVIDSMEDIAEFDPFEICLFPTLLEPFVLQRGIWGILPRENSLILLVDIKRLLRFRRSATN